MLGTILIVLLVLMLLGSPGNSFLRWRATTHSWSNTDGN